MSTSVKFGADFSSFIQGVTNARANVKALDAELKRNEAQFKATGNAEQYLTDKARLLKMQMNAQNNEVNNLQKALDRMRAAGVVPTSTEFMNLQRQLSNAQTSLLNMSVELNNVAVSEQNAAQGADKMVQSVSNIGKKMSLDQVIRGIDMITGTMEKAASMAVKLGKAIWDNITDSASWADNVATQATIMGVSVEEYQQLQGVFDTIADVTVNDWMNARRKIRQAINDPTQDQIDVLAALGISTHETVNTGFGMAEGLAKDWETVFWEAAKRMKSMVERGQITEEMAGTWGEALFGKKFDQLMPLIKLGQEAFTEGLGEQITVSEEAIDKLAELNDAYIDLKNDWEKLEAQVLSGLAPALTQAAGVLDSLLENLMEYLKSEDGQRLLENMGEVVSNMFADLSNINAEEVVNNFTSVFNKVTESLQWVVDNWEGVVNAMKSIVIGWGALKLTGGALQILQLVNGLKGLGASGAASDAAAAGAAAGASWGGAFAAAVLAAAPWLLSIIAANAIPDENKVHKEERVEAATYTEAEISRLREWVELQNELLLVNAAYGTGNFDEGKFNLLSGKIAALGNVQQGDLWSRYWDYLMSNDIMPGMQTMPTDFLDRMFRETTGHEYTPPKLEVLPEPAPGAEEMIQEKLNMMKLFAEVELVPKKTYDFLRGGAGGGGGGRFGDIEFHANGLPMVPWDGYPAILHKGERVVPARAMSNTRNYNSNLYVENMVMNNGQDADGLALRVAAAQRQMNRGYGS